MSTQAISSNGYTAKEINTLVNKKIIATVYSVAVSIIMILGQRIVVNDFLLTSDTILFLTISNPYIRTIVAGIFFVNNLKYSIEYTFKALANFFNLVGYWTTNNVELLTMKN
jgi:hypothetical protein